MGIPDIRQLVTLEFEVYGHVQGGVSISYLVKTAQAFVFPNVAQSLLPWAKNNSYTVARHLDVLGFV